MCSGMSLKTLNVDGFEALRFTSNKSFETICAGAVGDFENAEFVVVPE